MSAAGDKILARLQRPDEEVRKPLSIPLKLSSIRRLDDLARVLTQHSGVTTTRNMLIEDAVDSLLEEAAPILESKGIEFTASQADSPVSAGRLADDFDTIVFPAQPGEQYRRAFFTDHEWRFVRVDKRKIPHIRYIALYIGAPQSSIRHYAEVAPDGFHFDPETKKYRIKLNGPPKELPHPIPRGTASPQAVRSAKYTTLERLLSAQDFRSLYADTEA